MDPSNVSGNWKKLQSQLAAKPVPAQQSDQNVKKRKRRPEVDTSPHAIKDKSRKRAKQHHAPRKGIERAPASKPIHYSAMSSPKVSGHPKDQINAGLAESIEIGKYIAIDCEMVGVGPQPGPESALARVSVVNYEGEQVYDSYVKPKKTVTDWRTYVSGIQPKHMINARSFEEVQQSISDLLQDRILVGHSVSHDLDALLLSHPRRDIRDTARHPPFRRMAGGSSPRLKILASELLGLTIQTGEHSSIEDARACIMLFKRDKAAFQREHARKYPPPRLPLTPNENGEARPKKNKKKKRKK